MERGRNIVSASRDGTARLWDCGKSACLAKYAADSVVNGCSLHTPASIDLLQPDHVPGTVLVAANHRLLLLLLLPFFSRYRGQPVLAGTLS